MIAQPSTKSLLTVLVKPTEIGELFGAISVVDAVAGIVSQLCVNTLYAATVKTMPNLTFYFCAAVAFLACVTAFFVHPSLEHYDDMMVPDDILTDRDESSNPIAISTMDLETDNLNIKQRVARDSM